jgi:hypothetical protein
VNVEVVGADRSVVVGAVVVGAVAGAVVVGAVVVGAVVVGAVVVGAVVVGAVVVGAVVVGAVVVGAVAVGGVVGVVTPSLLTVKSARRVAMAPLDHVSTALILCDPSTNLVVSYGSAMPLAAVPAKSKGGIVSVRVGGAVNHMLSR